MNDEAVEGSSHGGDWRARAQDGLETALGTPFTAGNRIEILQNGDDMFPAMLDAIRGARKRIEFLTFIYWTGPIADEFATALSDRARAGVEVLVMLDAFGAKQIRRELVRRMKSAGCRVLWFNRMTTVRLWRIDNRTHRKVLVVDGQVGFTGGAGIAKEWQGAGDRPENWRDNHFRIRGPAVRGLRGGFFSDWMEEADTASAALGQLRDLEPAGDCLVQVVTAQANYGWGDIARLQDVLIRVAERRIRIQTPYFAPSKVQFNALLDARQRGVDVEFMIPGPHSDRRISKLAGSDEIMRLLEAGCMLWRFQPTMLHSKTITVDGELASVGTANLNTRSVNKDNELAVTVLDRAFTAHMDAIWDADRAQSRQSGPDEWRHRGLLRRTTELLANPFQKEA